MIWHLPLKHVNTNAKAMSLVFSHDYTVLNLVTTIIKGDLGMTHAIVLQKSNGNYNGLKKNNTWSIEFLMSSDVRNKCYN